MRAYVKILVIFLSLYEIDTIIILNEYYFEQGTFAINTETGSLTVADVLDWETKHNYVLIIEAWDNYQFGYTAGESRHAFKQIQYVHEKIDDWVFPI